MKEFIAQFENPDLKRINLGLINRDYDSDLVEHVVDVCRSLKVIKYIDFLDYTFTDDARDIDLDDYLDMRKKKKKGRQATEKYKYLHDSKYGEIRARFRLTVKGKTEIIEKKFLIPLTDEFGYYTIKGKKFFSIFQLVESSTYAKGQSVILKSLMPVVVCRKQKEIKNTDGDVFQAYTYAVQIFSRIVDVFYFYFSKMGVEDALRYFGLNNVVKFTQAEEDKENYHYFGINSDLFLQVSKELFNKHDYIRNCVASILAIITNRLQYENLEDKDFWISKLGSLSSQKAFAYYEKGINTITMFDRMLDEGTKRIIKVHDINKNDIYSVVRWMIQNFAFLRKKDDVDLKNKRLRCNEYIASFLTMEFSKRINRVLSTSEKDMTLDLLKDIFAVPGDIIITKLHSSGLKK